MYSIGIDLGIEDDDIQMLKGNRIYYYARRKMNAIKSGTYSLFCIFLNSLSIETQKRVAV